MSCYFREQALHRLEIYKRQTSLYPPYPFSPSNQHHLIMKATVAILTTLTVAAQAKPVEQGPKIYAVAPMGDAVFHPVNPVENNDASGSFHGGEKIAHKDYPWMIAGLRSGGGRAQTQSCSGSVIGPRKILTAAHCADAAGTKTWVYGSDDLNKGELTKIEVVSYKKHPKYVNFDKGYDVAVVTTKTDIPGAEGKYAKFATSKDKDLFKAGKEAWGYGYGKKDKDDKGKNVELHRAKLPLEGHDKCTESGQGLKVLGETMVCSGFEKGDPSTILQGDSGGPLVVDGTIIGVGSWSKSTWDWYSIYARLDNDMGDWVAEELKK